MASVVLINVVIRLSSLREGLGVGFLSPLINLPSLREGPGVGFSSLITSLTHADNFLFPACCADSVMTTVSIQMMLPILFISSASR